MTEESEFPMVSVRIVTYNQSRFIRQALDSVISQKTNFRFEIVVGEDCSTDGTREIVRSYEDRYPELFRVTYHNPNKGRLHNFYDTLARCTGKYIAMLDGDDYWTSVDKLQIQYDFLERHPEFPLCYHLVNKVWPDDPSRARTIVRDKSEYSLEDILRMNYVAPSAAMFRAACIPQIPEIYNDLPFCDWPFYLAMARSGSFYSMSDILGVYRVHDKGLWSSLSKRKQLRANAAFYHAVLQEGIEDEDLVAPLLSETEALLAKRRLLAKVKSRVQRLFVG